MKIDEINLQIKQKKKGGHNNYRPFLENAIKMNPFELFMEWFSEALLVEQNNPCVMVLATVDKNGLPATRAVAIQELQMGQFIFYSTYDGRKAQHIANQQVVAANFYWPNLARQVRVKANAVQLDRKKCEAYFSSRERDIQLSIHAWEQSSILLDRKDLDNRIQQTSQQFLDKKIPCPKHWGGYAIVPFEYEFYQKREMMQNDIFLYTLSQDKWEVCRLAP
jgi:pyridoxamine 5'-phosphate oxidase